MASPKKLTPYFVASFLIFLTGLSEKTHALDPVATGSHIASGGNITAISTIESQIGQDLNGDGDRSDRILQIHNVSDGSLTNTGIVVWGNYIATDGETIVFMHTERTDYVDRNGNGNTLDEVMAYYNINSGTLKITNITPYTNGGLPDFSVHGNYIVFVQREFSSGQDFNGDLDQNDSVIRYLDIGANQVYNTPLVSSSAMVDDGVIATRVVETSAIDANSDGDNNDIVFVTYDISSTQLNAFLETPIFNLSNIGAFPYKDGNNYFFRARETQLNEDVDGNGSISSRSVIMVRDLSTGNQAWTGVESSSGAIMARGSYLTYETSESAIGQDINGDGNLQYDFVHALHNLSDNSVEYVIDRGRVSLGSDVFSYALWENYTGDVNGDGDTSDTIVYVQSLVQPVVPGQCVSDDIHCRLQRFISDIHATTTISSADRNTLAGYVQQADDVLTQGNHANDMEMYIAVIDAFDVFFDNIWPMQDVPHDDKMYLVESHPDGRALKDHIHDLKDQAAADLQATQQQSNNNQGGGNGNAQAQQLIAGMAVAVQGSGAPMATKQLLMAEINGIIGIALQIMNGGADPSTLIPTLVGHIQTMVAIIGDPAYGVSVADANAILAAISDFQAMLSGGP